MQKYKIVLIGFLCQFGSFSCHSLNSKLSDDQEYQIEPNNDQEGLPASRIVSAQFDDEAGTLVLQHEDGHKTTANLENEDDCIYRGYLVGCTYSRVLVTGCKESMQDVQIQSKVFGDMIFSLQDGTVVPLETRRDKRELNPDTDYDYDDAEPNPEFEAKFPKLDSRECGMVKCPTNCLWDTWSSWGSCSATCGGGSQSATRNVDQEATNGGHQCKGSKKRSQECGMKECPTDCAWGAWSSWSSCSATCGGGSQYATRQMTNQATGGGELCQGEPVKSQQCGLTQCDSVYLLTSSGVAAEIHGARLGLYDEIKHEYGGRVFKQRGAEVFIYKKDDTWWCGSTVGAYKGYFYSYDLFSKPGEWYYYGEDWQNNDPTLHFLPLSPFSCILQPSIQITSTGPALTRRPDYLGTFWIVQDVFSAGRPVWRNNKGKVLKIRPGKVNFGVYDGIEETGAYIRSASGPTCPTDTKAGHSDWIDVHAWRFWDGKKGVEDYTITVQ